MKSFYVKATKETTQQMIEELFELCVSKGGAFPFSGSTALQFPHIHTWFGVSLENQCQILLGSSRSSPGLILTYEEALALFDEKPEEIEKPFFDYEKFEELVESLFNKEDCCIDECENYVAVVFDAMFELNFYALDEFLKAGADFRCERSNSLVFKKILD